MPAGPTAKMAVLRSSQLFNRATHDASSGAKDHQETSIDGLACLLFEIGSAVKILTRGKNPFGAALP